MHVRVPVARSLPPMSLLEEGGPFPGVEHCMAHMLPCVACSSHHCNNANAWTKLCPWELRQVPVNAKEGAEGRAAVLTKQDMSALFCGVQAW